MFAFLQHQKKFKKLNSIKTNMVSTKTWLDKIKIYLLIRSFQNKQNNTSMTAKLQTKALKKSHHYKLYFI